MVHLGERDPRHGRMMTNLQTPTGVGSLDMR